MGEAISGTGVPLLHRSAPAGCCFPFADVCAVPEASTQAVSDFHAHPRSPALSTPRRAVSCVLQVRTGANRPCSRIRERILPVAAMLQSGVMKSPRWSAERRTLPLEREARVVTALRLRAYVIGPCKPVPLHPSAYQRSASLACSRDMQSSEEMPRENNDACAEF